MTADDIILLSGSYARGTNTERSDVDWIVISENANYFYTETVWEGGKESQIILMPRQKIHKMVMEKSYDSYGIIVSMLKSCIVVKDDIRNFGGRLSEYIDHLDNPPSEQASASYMSTLSNRCDDLENTEDEFAKAMYVSTIMVLLSHLLSQNFITGTKHSIRKILSSHVREELLDAYNQYARTGDASALVEYSRNKIELFRRDILTTGISLNNTKEKDPVVIFFPKKQICDKGVFKLIAGLTGKFEGCDFHVFSHGKFQAMNEGVYIYVHSDTISSSEICRKIRSYDITVVKKRRVLGIEMVYPYYTTFATGAYFGGKGVFDTISPAFSEIWKEYFHMIVNKPQDFVVTYSIVCGISLITRICALIGSEDDTVELLRGILELLLPDVVDKRGLYNAAQTKYLRESTIESFKQQYELGQNRFISTLIDVECGNVEELLGMNAAFSSICNIIGTIKKEDLKYADIYPFENPMQVFLMEIVLHILSIFQLTQEQKFGIVFNYSMGKGLCLDDFLSPDK